MYHIQFKASRQDFIKERLIHKKIEFAQLRKQMEIFATFLPNFFLEEGHMEGTQFVGVLLNIQIVGIHKLVEKFNKFHDGGIYRLSSTLNAFIGAIIEAVTYWGGDVLKIYGDTMLNLWKVSADESLFHTLHSVVLCAIIVRDCLKNFDTGLSQKLRVKMGISCGNLVICSYGLSVRNFILRGDAMEFGTKMINEGRSGEIYVSSRAWAHIKQARYDAEMIDETRVLIKGVKIVYKAKEIDMREMFARRELEVRILIRRHLLHMKKLQAVRQIDTKIVYSEIERDFINQLPPRPAVTQAPKKCSLELLRSHVYSQIQSHIDSNQFVEYLTEITTLAIQVIRIAPNSRECVSNAFVQYTFNEISKAIEPTQAFIYKFELEKDIRIVIINSHGQRKDIECQRSLQIGFALKQQFDNIPGVYSCSVGTFQGHLYCGVMGHPHRRDYAVLGSILLKSVNAVAFYEGKSICDYRTFRFSKLPSFYFRCIGTKKCRHHWDVGQILEYDETNNMMQEEVNVYTKIFGRNKELKRIIACLESKSPTGKGVILSADDNYGKTYILEHVYACIQPSDQYFIASLTLDEMITPPLFAIFKLYRQFHDRLISRVHDLAKIPHLSQDLTYLLEDLCEDDDDDLRKYYILQCFKELFQLANECKIAIFINNFECIDPLSWEMLEIIMKTEKCRIIGAGEFTQKYAYILEKLYENNCIEIIDLEYLSNEWIITIACEYLEVGAISEHLARILCKLCNGKPGYISYCVSFLTSSESLALKYLAKEDVGPTYIKICPDIYDSLPNKIPVMDIVYKTSLAISEDTILSISKEFYHTLKPFEQRVLKTSSVLGRTFPRNLLVVALHYPDVRKLCGSIKSLFSKGVFTCGSSAISGTEFLSSKFCCRCYMTDSEMLQIKQDKYPFCKLLHFRSRNFCTAVYAMVPENERKDIHILCTDVLESTQNICPDCIRNPMNSYFLMSRYKDVLEICDSRTMTFAKCEKQPNIKAIKTSIRTNILQLSDQPPNKGSDVLKEMFDIKDCYCLDIQMFVYRQLIHHSNKASHLGKSIFFQAAYGFTLMLYNATVEAIAVLRKARELCFVDMGDPGCEVTSCFRKYLVGKISYSLASCFIHLRQLIQSKNQIKIALRQYNIPLVSMHFIHFRALLRKSYIANLQNFRGRNMVRHEWMKWEVAMCTSVCAKIFCLEGDWTNAKYCSKYSIWIMKHLNQNIPMIMDLYCSVVDLYHYGAERDTCSKLQKYVAKECMCYYTNNNNSHVRCLIYWLAVNFELHITSGQLNASVRLLYRLFDVMLKFRVFLPKFECVNWIGILFTYTLRFKDYIDMIHVLDVNMTKSSSLWYYACALGTTLLIGYTLTPIDALIKNILKIVTFGTDQKLSWDRYYLLSLIYLHYMKLDNSNIAEKYKPHCPLTGTTLRKPVAMNILLNIIDASLMDFYNRKSKHNRFKTNVEKQFELARTNIKSIKILLPKYHCLMAWKFKLHGDHKKAKFHLKKATNISRKQSNLYYISFVKRLRSAWKSPTEKPEQLYRDRININLISVLDFNETMWEKNLIPYPI